MKMRYHPKNRSRYLYRKNLVIVILILVLGSVFFSYSDGLLMRIASPIWSIENKVATKFWSMTSFFRSKDSLIKENEALRNKVNSDALLVELNRTLISARQSLLEEYGRNPNVPGVAASVLVHPPVTPYDILVVDVGQDEGVEIGDSVTLPEGGKIGSVIEVFDKTSKIKLYSANGESNQAILERESLPVDLLGQGGGSFMFTLPREIAVEVGDKILAPTIDSPLIGVVESIEVTPTDSFKKVLVRSVAPVYSLRFVLIQS